VPSLAAAFAVARSTEAERAARVGAGARRRRRTSAQTRTVSAFEIVSRALTARALVAERGGARSEARRASVHAFAASARDPHRCVASQNSPSLDF